MAEKEGGGKLETASGEIIKAEPIHSQLSDAAQFSFGAVCALLLQRLFEEECHSEFNKDALRLILNGLEQPKQVQESIQAIYEGQGSEDLDPYVQVIADEEVLKKDAGPLISELVGFAIAQGTYDARMRVLVKHVGWRLRVSSDSVDLIETALAESLIASKYDMSEDEKKEQEKKAKRSKYKRFALIGLATVTGGTLIGLTGGLAAPLLAAGAGAIIGGAGAAALGSAAGVAIIGSLFGVAGAGLTGYKMKKRVGAIEEFEFEPLISAGPLQLHTVTKQLHITIAVTGWIDNKMSDFKQPWQNLAESQEQYSLRWESRYLRDMGQALDYIFNSAVSLATSEALKYTVLSTIMAAITWPSALLSASQVIDNPWSVALQRAVATGRQLAEVLLSREQGKRPVTLIGYSLGGRVIFYCLEEMARRKGCEGIIEDVIILGAPVPGNEKSWSSFSRVVAGRIVNGYCRGDWLLKFLYRTSSVQLRIAGLAPVKWTNRRMHNIDLSDVVSGHMDYRVQLDTILRVIGVRMREGVKVQAKKGHGLSPSSSSATSGSASATSSKPASPVSSHSDASVSSSSDEMHTKNFAAEAKSETPSENFETQTLSLGVDEVNTQTQSLSLGAEGRLDEPQEDYFSASAKKPTDSTENPTKSARGQESSGAVDNEENEAAVKDSSRKENGVEAVTTATSNGKAEITGDAESGTEDAVNEDKHFASDAIGHGDGEAKSVSGEGSNNAETNAISSQHIKETTNAHLTSEDMKHDMKHHGPGIFKSTGGKIKSLLTKRSHAAEGAHAGENANKQVDVKNQEKMTAAEKSKKADHDMKQHSDSEDSYTSSDPESPELEENKI